MSGVIQSTKQRSLLVSSCIIFLLATSCGVLRNSSSDMKTTSSPIPTPTSSKRNSSSDANPFAQNARLGRGVNLGNALEAPIEGAWGVTLRAEYFQLIKEAGFDSVRIPIRWSAHAQATPPYTIDASFFERVDWAVEQSLSNGLLAIINMHHYEEIFTDPATHKERFIALWDQIATHYQRYSTELIFELLNEPHAQLSGKLWNPLMTETLSTVRRTNPQRNVIIGPVEWNNLRALDGLELPAEDQHIIVTFHYYEPFHFTHQGAEWVEGSALWKGMTWQGSESEKNAVTRDFDRAQAWAERNQRPLFMGEFGAYSKADITSRARWTDYVARQAEERGFSWAYWEFCAGFGVYDRDKQTWNQSILEALIP